ncbi:anticodon binding domain-containing protein [Cystoisospora suis]|uniref:Anticodon binding domain-containing protein n=1 Tax=Cystoisospora suis TaxID=483139 RepID=A0A2C6LGD8_9APIC|nr:anticodon binding domain-containing protein [Cystoisospora suis]
MSVLAMHLSSLSSFHSLSYLLTSSLFILFLCLDNLEILTPTRVHAIVSIPRKHSKLFFSSLPFTSFSHDHRRYPSSPLHWQRCCGFKRPSFAPFDNPFEQEKKKKKIVQSSSSPLRILLPAFLPSSRRSFLVKISSSRSAFLSWLSSFSSLSTSLILPRFSHVVRGTSSSISSLPTAFLSKGDAPPLLPSFVPSPYLSRGRKTESSSLRIHSQILSISNKSSIDTVYTSSLNSLFSSSSFRIDLRRQISTREHPRDETQDSRDSASRWLASIVSPFSPQTSTGRFMLLQPSKEETHPRFKQPNYGRGSKSGRRYLSLSLSSLSLCEDSKRAFTESPEESARGGVEDRRREEEEEEREEKKKREETSRGKNRNPDEERMNSANSPERKDGEERRKGQNRLQGWSKGDKEEEEDEDTFGLFTEGSVKMSEEKQQAVNLDELRAFCKEHAFVTPTAEIYGGLKGVQDFGAVGYLFLKNLRASLHNFFIQSQDFSLRTLPLLFPSTPPDKTTDISIPFSSSFLKREEEIPSLPNLETSELPAINDLSPPQSGCLLPSQDIHPEERRFQFHEKTGLDEEGEEEREEKKEKKRDSENERRKCGRLSWNLPLGKAIRLGQVFSVETASLSPFEVLRASGHAMHFVDSMVECLDTGKLFRTDALVYRQVCDLSNQIGEERKDEEVKLQFEIAPLSSSSFSFSSSSERHTDVPIENLGGESDKEKKKKKRERSSSRRLSYSLWKPLTQAPPEVFRFLPSPVTGRPGGLSLPFRQNLMLYTRLSRRLSEGERASSSYIQGRIREGISCLKREEDVKEAKKKEEEKVEGEKEVTRIGEERKTAFDHVGGEYDRERSHARDKADGAMIATEERLGKPRDLRESLRVPEEQSEKVRYFIDPRQEDAVSVMNAWVHKLLRFFIAIDLRYNGEEKRITKSPTCSISPSHSSSPLFLPSGLPKNSLALVDQGVADLAHYSSRCLDITFSFPFGPGELCGVALRTDADLRAHEKASGESLSLHVQSTLSHSSTSSSSCSPHQPSWLLRSEERQRTRERDFSHEAVHEEDEEETKSKKKQACLPYVIEPSIGLERLFLALLISGFVTDVVNGKPRRYLNLHPALAPFTVAVFPVVTNVESLKEKAHELFRQLSPRFSTFWDGSSTSIGRRYRRADELGVPYCLTVDHQTLGDGSVTVRWRNSAEQRRIYIHAVESFLLARTRFP